MACNLNFEGTSQMELLAAHPGMDAKHMCVINMTRNVLSIRNKTEEDFAAKSDKHFHWLDEIVAEVRTSLEKFELSEGILMY